MINRIPSRNASSAIVPALLLAAVTLLGGCQAYTITIEMEAANSASVRVTGNAPFVVVENLGPGVVEATFEAGSDAAEQRRIASGTASGRTLRVTRTIAIETGADRAAKVMIKATGATGAVIEHGPAPSSER